MRALLITGKKKEEKKREKKQNDATKNKTKGHLSNSGAMSRELCEIRVLWVMPRLSERKCFKQLTTDCNQLPTRISLSDNEHSFPEKKKERKKRTA